MTRMPVAASAFAVSAPMPLETPVIRATFPGRALRRSLSLTIWRAVGRASPGPWGFLWTEA